jgi:hypothetical protein
MSLHYTYYEKEITTKEKKGKRKAEGRGRGGGRWV